jgi:ParB family chromosome partitioning protein
MKTANEVVKLIDVENLKQNPDQARKNFDGEELNELANSIREQRIIQPIIAEDNGDGTYTITDGERRRQAAQLAELKEVPVILRKYTHKERMVVSLIANIQRTDLNSIEEASAYKQIMDADGITPKEVASKVGKNRATVANTLRLLNLPSDIQEYLRKNKLSAGHARAILSVKGYKNQKILFEEISNNYLSVREAERRAKALNPPPTKVLPPKGLLSSEMKAMRQELIKKLGTRVTIQGDNNKGTIIINYNPKKDFKSLYKIIIGSEQ